MSKWSDIKMYDLSIPIGVNTPPWPTYEPLQMKFFKRLAPNGANGQLMTHSNHVGTHLDGPLHFDTAGRDMASLELTKLCHPGVVVDLSDEFGEDDWGIYTAADIEKRVEVKKGDILVILEAMKMENEILAPRDGVVVGVSVTKGSTVNSGDLLVSLQ